MKSEPSKEIDVHASHRQFERTFGLGDHLIPPRDRFATSYERSLIPPPCQEPLPKGTYEIFGRFFYDEAHTQELFLRVGGDFNLSGLDLEGHVEGTYTQDIKTRHLVFPESMHPYLAKFPEVAIITNSWTLE